MRGELLATLPHGNAVTFDYTPEHRRGDGFHLSDSNLLSIAPVQTSRSAVPAGQSRQLTLPPYLHPPEASAGRQRPRFDRWITSLGKAENDALPARGAHYR